MCVYVSIVLYTLLHGGNKEYIYTYSSLYLMPREISYCLYAILEAVDSENDVTTIQSMVTPAVRVITADVFRCG